MLQFGLWALLLCLVAVGFVVWPIVRRGGSVAESDDSSESAEREDLVLSLFNEQKTVLDQQLASGDIDEASHRELTRELELSLLDNAGIDTSSQAARSRFAGARWLVVASFAVPALAAVVYWQRGHLPDVHIQNLRSDYYQAVESGGQTAASPLLVELIEALQQRIQTSDNNGNHYLLARAQMQSGDYGAAIKAYTAMLKDDPPAYILGELAQAIFLAMGNQVTNEVRMLTERALQMDPQESTALGLAGIDAFQQGQYPVAIDYWQRAVAQLGVQSPGAQSLMAGISRAQTLMAESGEAAAATGTDKPQLSVKVEVALGEGVQVAPDAVLFVYARAWEGPKMPLAIAKLQAAELPVSVELDESMSMAPGMTMSQFDTLEIVARISSSGSPVAQEGDWQASSGALAVEQLKQGVTLSIRQQL